MNIYIIEDIRTNNFTDLQFSENIEGAWSRARNVLDFESDMFAVYTDYHSDYRGDYSIGIGSQDPEHGTLLVLDETNPYQKFSVDPEQGVQGTWKQIWELEDKGLLKRAYTIDFEHIKLDGTIDIYIAI